MVDLGQFVQAASVVCLPQTQFPAFGAQREGENAFERITAVKTQIVHACPSTELEGVAFACHTFTLSRLHGFLP